MAAEDLAKVEGVFAMSLYSDSVMPGDFIDYLGFRWRIIGRVFTANRYRKRNEPRKVPQLLVEFVATVDNC